MLTEQQARKWGEANGVEVSLCCTGDVKSHTPYWIAKGYEAIPDYHEGGDALWEWVDLYRTAIHANSLTFVGRTKLAAIAALDRWCESVKEVPGP